MKKIVYDKRTGNEVILDKSDVCPISGRWLVPGSCTEVEPPEREQGFALEFVGGEWRQFEILDEEQVKDEEQDRLEPEVQTLESRVEELRREIATLEDRVEELKKR